MINYDTKQISFQIEFWKFPSVLIVTLKRFTNSIRKNQSLVDFPFDNLDLSKYVIGYDPKSFNYELYGICNHTGGVMGGHYYAYVKNANEKWYEFNDARVEEFTNLDNIKIDLLDIDVEGADLKVLKGLSFKKFRPELICVEIHDKNLRGSETYKFLINLNYELIWSGVFSHIFRSKT